MLCYVIITKNSFNKFIIIIFFKSIIYYDKIFFVVQDNFNFVLGCLSISFLATHRFFLINLDFKKIFFPYSFIKNNNKIKR